MSECRTLSATRRLWRRSCARYTVAVPPRPSSRSIAYELPRASRRACDAGGNVAVIGRKYMRDAALSGPVYRVLFTNTVIVTKSRKGEAGEWALGLKHLLVGSNRELQILQRTSRNFLRLNGRRP